MRFSSLLIALLFIGITACKENNAPEFDRTALLENVSNNVIIPNITQFNTELGSLENAANTFNTTPNAANLLALKSQFTSAYVQFQHVKMYDFGPGEDARFKVTLNTYPTSTTQIENNIASGTYNLETAENGTAIGFPALDFMLFSGTDTETLDQYTTAGTASNAKAYLLALITKMKADFSPVNAAWTGAYKTTFIAANGTDVGSSISLFFNSMVKDIELVKNAKIGIPSGQLSGGETFPDFVEGLHSKHGRVLALENTKALQNLFLGGAGTGLDDYMNFVEEHEGVNVTAEQVNIQFDACIAKINALGTDFNADIPINGSNFAAAFQEMKKLVAYAKTDISATLGVLISFSDTDGD